MRHALGKTGERRREEGEVTQGQKKATSLTSRLTSRLTARLTSRLTSRITSRVPLVSPLEQGNLFSGKTVTWIVLDCDLDCSRFYCSTRACCWTRRRLLSLPLRLPRLPQPENRSTNHTTSSSRSVSKSLCLCVCGGGHWRRGHGLM